MILVVYFFLSGFEIEGQACSPGHNIMLYRDSSNIRYIGGYDTPDCADFVYVSGNYAYVADDDSGLRIIDISNLYNPHEAGYFDTTGLTWGVYVLGDYAYVAHCGSGLRILNISSPSNPYQVGSYNTPGYSHFVDVVYPYAYVADNGAGLRIINISNPSAPHEVGYCDTPGDGRAVCVKDSFAYFADWQGGLRIIKISNPASPYEVGYLTFLPYESWDVGVSGNYAYLACGAIGLRVIDISDPSNPQEVGYFVTPTYCYGVFVNNHYTYIVDTYYLHVIDITAPSNPQEVGYYATPGSSQDVFGVGNYAFVADGYSGLGIYEFYGTSVNETSTCELNQNFTLFSNPVSHVLSFKVNVCGLFSVELYNLSGQKIKDIFKGNADRNKTYSIPMASGQIATGVYFIRFSRSSISRFEKVVILSN